MKLWLMIAVMAMTMGGCAFNGDRRSTSETTAAHHAACKKAEFDHAAMRICAADDAGSYFCRYCVDQRGVMWPFEDKTE